MTELCVTFGTDGVPFIQLDKQMLRLEMEELDEEHQNIARAELRETPEIVQDAMERLRQLISDDKDLTVPSDDEEFLYKFLRPCKFYPESAFKLMRNFFKYKVKHPKLCIDLVPSKQRNAFTQGIIQFLPRRDQFGRRLMVIQSGYKWKPKKCSLDEIWKAVMLSLEAAMCEPITQVMGVVCILDMEGLSVTHVYQFSPMFAKSVLDWVQECTPVRLKAIHVINQPYIFNMLFGIFKPFIVEKLRKRIHFHGTQRAEFLKAIGEENIPTNYGGMMQIPEMPGDLLCDILEHYEDEYKEWNELGYINRR